VGAGCNQVAFLDTPPLAAAPNSSYTLHLGAMGRFVDMGWCARSVDGEPPTHARN
jgi:hypothetical protein